MYVTVNVTGVIGSLHTPDKREFTTLTTHSEINLIYSFSVVESFKLLKKSGIQKLDYLFATKSNTGVLSLSVQADLAC